VTSNLLAHVQSLVCTNFKYPAHLTCVCRSRLLSLESRAVAQVSIEYPEYPSARCLPSLTPDLTPTLSSYINTSLFITRQNLLQQPNPNIIVTMKLITTILLAGSPLAAPLDSRNYSSSPHFPSSTNPPQPLPPTPHSTGWAARTSTVNALRQATSYLPLPHILQTAMLSHTKPVAAK
jgi:hypothetical protein